MFVREIIRELGIMFRWVPMNATMSWGSRSNSEGPVPTNPAVSWELQTSREPGRKKKMHLSVPRNTRKNGPYYTRNIVWEVNVYMLYGNAVAGMLYKFIYLFKREGVAMSICCCSSLHTFTPAYAYYVRRNYTYCLLLFLHAILSITHVGESPYAPECPEPYERANRF